MKQKVGPKSPVDPVELTPGTSSAKNGGADGTDGAAALKRRANGGKQRTAKPTTLGQIDTAPIAFGNGGTLGSGDGKPNGRTSSTGNGSNGNSSTGNGHAPITDYVGFMDARRLLNTLIAVRKGDF